ncbi:replicative DNA helicase [Methylomagnum ishizawai]|uniref:Replicative DNA helicase n=1 Tax=Methylomagnum ishizawai TaxID=1760988 RepID=A0A1Y6D693_9GAMM|nr:DnaB-like helicase C-terminal domain-containing protein [Methylomagnum ishizawai]SMF96062.1 replicative DNA helicase [Methylomagnum ishizawai]
MDRTHLEQQIAGLFLQYPKARLETGLELSDFSDWIARNVFHALGEVLAHAGRSDIFAVVEASGKLHGELALNLATVAGLYKDCVGVESLLPVWAAALKEESRRTKTLELLETAHEALGDATQSPDKVRGRLMLRLADLDAPVRKWNHTAGQIMAGVVDRVEEIDQCRRSGKPRGLPTGISNLDQGTGGLHPGDLTIVGGRPGMGKTAFMLGVAIHLAQAGHRAGIVSAEMSAEELGLRMVSHATGISGDRLRRGDLGQADFGRIAGATGQIAGLPLLVFDRPQCTGADIALQARAWMLGGGLSVLFVDYLQRLRNDREFDSINYAIGDNTKALKNLARDLNIPVVCLAAVNRKCEDRPGKRPAMADLRDCGEIESEADQILFLFRRGVYEQSAPPHEAEIIIEKNRHGPLATVSARFDQDTMRWSGTDAPATASNVVYGGW